MSRISDWQKIQSALANGLVREQGVPAELNQAMTFVLSDRKFFHHATLASAKAEKEFLQTALGKRIRLYKVWNTSRKNVQTDMSLIRTGAEQLSNQSEFYKALDRVLMSSGF